MNPQSRPVGLVLLHGAGLGAWIWRDVEPLLERPAFAVDFPFRDGTDAQRKHLGLSDYVDHVQAQIEAGPLEHVILVAHSISGIVAVELAARLPERVVGIVGVGAVIPKGANSFVSCLPQPQRTLIRVLMRLLGTRPPDGAIRTSLCSGLSDTLASEVIERFVPESRALYLDRPSAPLPALATGYVKLTEDPEFALALQEKMAANLAAQEVFSIASGHLPMLSHPQALAAHLDAVLTSVNGLAPHLVEP
ncbi:MAG: alpha/beta hydrolase [Bradymonadaceae bacterium]|nr:alpha/beta hydrolase [Lujinxingiaceae bacterium]